MFVVSIMSYDSKRYSLLLLDFRETTVLKQNKRKTENDRSRLRTLIDTGECVTSLTIISIKYNATHL